MDEFTMSLFVDFFFFLAPELSAKPMVKKTVPCIRTTTMIEGKVKVSLYASFESSRHLRMRG